MFFISELYPDLDNKFPNEIDDFERFIDPNIESLQAINLYYQFFDSGNLIEATNILNNNPELKRMIINAESMNKVRDAIVSLERYYLDDLQQYIINIVEYRGLWSPSAKYEKFSVVSYEGQAYMATQNYIPFNTPPTIVEYWIPLVIKGDKGDAGLNLAFQGEWKPDVNYSINDAVEYEGSLYGALQGSLNQPPTIGSSNQFWSLAWDFQIPDNYIVYNMLSTQLQNTITNANTFYDDVTGVQYRFGASDGAIYIEEI